MVMPNIVTVLALLILNNANVADFIQGEDVVVRNAIDDALSQLRHIILNGDPERGIPVLDPLHVEARGFHVDELSAEGSLSDVRLEGLGAFVVEKWTTIPVPIVPPPPPRLTVSIRVPATRATGDYRLRGTAAPAAASPLDARGNFTIVVKDITFTVKLVLTITLKVKSVDVSLGIGDIFIDVQGAGEVGDLINNEAAGRIDAWLADNRSDMELQLADFIKEALQSYLDKQTQPRVPLDKLAPTSTQPT